MRGTLSIQRRMTMRWTDERSACSPLFQSSVAGAFLLTGHLDLPFARARIRPFDVGKARIIEAHLRLRLGMLMPDHSDKWWTVSPDRTPVAQKIVELPLQIRRPLSRKPPHNRSAHCLVEIRPVPRPDGIPA